MTTIDAIRTRGFLSGELQQFQDRYRADFAAAFDQFEAISVRATTNLFTLKLARLEGVQSRAMLFWMKCVAGCQAACLLLERGMATQAQVLIRTAAEDLFFGCALLRDETVLDRLAEEDEEQRRKQVEGMLKSMKGLHPQQRQILEELQAELPKKTGGIKAQRAAEIAGLLDLYQTVFRGMSLVAAHGTLTSLVGGVQDEGAGRSKLVFGPSPNGIEWTLGLAVNLLECGNQRFALVGR